MLVFKILVIVCLLFCIGIIVMNVHSLMESKRMLDSVRNWAIEIDKSNLNYIKQEFARLKIENNLIIKEEEDEQGNDFSRSEDDEEK